jgi:hypothetical protein
MFHTLTNVQEGEASSLLQPIDNREGLLCVGIRSATLTVGWYNINDGETFAWRSETVNRSLDIPAGLYSFEQLKETISAATSSVTLTVNQVNGLITLAVAEEWEVCMTDGLLTLLGLDDGCGGEWLGAGIYMGDRPIDFAAQKTVHVHLQEVSTTHNIVDGAPSTLLACIAVGCHSFGDIITTRMEHPEYKHLHDGSISEWNLTIRDARGRIIDNHNLPVSATLEIVSPQR